VKVVVSLSYELGEILPQMWGFYLVDRYPIKFGKEFRDVIHNMRDYVAKFNL
jgi:hypothetical protein